MTADDTRLARLAATGGMAVVAGLVEEGPGA